MILKYSRASLGIVMLARITRRILHWECGAVILDPPTIKYSKDRNQGETSLKMRYSVWKRLVSNGNSGDYGKSFVPRCHDLEELR